MLYSLQQVTQLPVPVLMGLLVLLSIGLSGGRQSNTGWLAGVVVALPVLAYFFLTRYVARELGLYVLGVAVITLGTFQSLFERR